MTPRIAGHGTSGKPAAGIASVGVTCAEDAACAASYPDPRGILDRLFARARAKPLHGTADGKEATADEVEIAMVSGRSAMVAFPPRTSLRPPRTHSRGSRTL